MTYNIRHGVGLDRVLDLERTAQVIRSFDTDIVILNEMDQRTERSFGVHQADSLGKLLAMEAQFGRSIDYDGGQYGNALLSRYPILCFSIVDLSTDSTLEGRSLFISQLEIHGDTVLVMGTHLGLQEGEQQEQVSRILETLSTSSRLVLAGDFNFEPNSRMYDRLNQRLKDGVESVSKPEYTFPADKPARRIDYIWLGEDLLALGSVVRDDPLLKIASDHLPQVLKIKLK